MLLTSICQSVSSSGGRLAGSMFEAANRDQSQVGSTAHASVAPAIRQKPSAHESPAGHALDVVHVFAQSFTSGE